MGGLNRLIHKKKKRSCNGIESICWDCIHSVPSPRKGTGCSWIMNKKPVADSRYLEKTVINSDGNGHHCETLLVMRECPQFKRG